MVKLIFLIFSFFLLNSCSDNNKKDAKIIKKMVRVHKKGILSGFESAMINELSPKIRKDRKISLGVYDTKKSEFFLLINVPQEFLRNFFLYDIEVEGVFYANYEHIIVPEKIYVFDEYGDRLKIFEKGRILESPRIEKE